MDLINLLFTIAVSIIIGIILTLLIQYYVLLNVFNRGPIADTPKKSDQEVFSLPESLRKKLEHNENSGSSLPISLMLQFLFHELRHSNNIKQWLYKKLSLEFDELLTKTTIGKFFEAVHIRDMHLGSQFPDINEFSLDSIDLDENDGYINTLNLSIKLDYTGNFLLAVDAKMKFGKTAFLSIKVKRINGVARLQFTRLPYSHWSFSFYTEPMIDLAVESHFQGRQLQSNITNLIVNQIKKAIKRKHSLPNYKIRYKPFFMKTDPGQLDQTEETEIVPQGQLEVSCGEVSRLAFCPQDVSSIYCTLTVDTVPFISLYQRDNVYYTSMELTLTKVHQQQLGVIFKQESSASVTVDSVTPLTPAYNSGLKSGDTILAIENKTITNVSQIGKIVKSTPTVTVSFKIERVSNNYVIKPNVSEDAEKSAKDEESVSPDIESPVSEKEDERKTVKKIEKVATIGNENMQSKFAHTIGNFTLRKRKASVEKPASGAGDGASNRSTPNASCPGTPQHSAAKSHAISLSPNFNNAMKKHSISEVPEIIRTDTENQEVELLNLVIGCKGKTLPLKPKVIFNDEYVFNLKDTAKYLNVNVWGTGGKNDILLGYTNISLNDVLDSCCNSPLGQYTRGYPFLPPNNMSPTMQTHPLMCHSGFEHVFCYGDILLSFVWNNPEDNGEVKRRNSVVNSEIKNKSFTRLNGSQHDFVRTQFHRSIHCDFCSKKIWLKDAVQCRNCGMCCHKKCVTKCKTSSECVSDRSDMKSDTSMDQSMEIIDTMDEESSSSFMKRVNSVNNLSLPGAHIPTSQSRSLPPSPQRTPTRKHSIQSLSDPFSLCPVALEEIQHATPSASHEAIHKLLDQILLNSSDENLMENARESGRQLYSTMESEERMDKINAMVGELKRMFDFISTEHVELTSKMGSEVSEVEKAKLAFLLGQADAKIQGLSVLMLHYCSGLQQL